jgi:hypothetical protein
LKDIIHANCELTVWEGAEETGIFTGSCHTVLTHDSGMHLVSVKFVPRLLTEIREFNVFQLAKIS